MNVIGKINQLSYLGAPLCHLFHFWPNIVHKPTNAQHSNGKSFQTEAQVVSWFRLLHPFNWNDKDPP